MAFAESFLTRPDLFPARAAGEGWGTERLDLDVAGGPYRVRGLAPEQAADLEHRYGPVGGGTADAAVEIRVFRVAGDDFKTIDRRGWTYSMDVDHDAHQVRLAGDRWMGRIQLSETLSGALWTSIPEGVRWTELFENFLRVVVAYRVLARGGVLLHSSGVVDDGSAVVFFGPSGAGKTTVARLSLAGSRAVLSDDINAVFRENDGLVVRKLPFAGELGPTEGRPDPVPLAGLARLEKADSNAAARLSSGQAVASLLAAAPFLNRDPYRLDQLTRSLERVVCEVPVVNLAFDLTGDFWPCLQETLAWS